MTYQHLLSQVRNQFPQPVSDPIHDSYFAHTVLRALDRVDAMKGEVPVLKGHKEELDYTRARRATLPSDGSSLGQVLKELVGYLEGTTLWGHPKVQQNVVPPATIVSLVGTLLAGLANPNLSWDEYAHGLAVAEVEACALAADLVGYDAELCGGLFTFGGTGTNLYALRVALETCLPGSFEEGIRQDVRLIASDRSHYCRYTIAAWLGLGSRNVITVPTLSDNSMNLQVLEQEWRRTLEQGGRVAAVVATMGTTDAFGIDDREGSLEMRNRVVR